jgi:FkbM family methyltransferase
VRAIINAGIAAYRALPRPIRSFAAGVVQSALRRRRTTTVVGGIRYELDLAEVIDLNLYLDTFEPEVTAAVRRYTKPGMTVLDIGANIGAHALRFAQLTGPGGRVIAFEPTEFAFRKLKRNAELNDFPQLEMVHIALSDQTLPAQRVNFRSSWRTDGSRADGESTVDFMPLDAWCREHALTYVDLIKIDVDGNEYPIFAGGREIIASSRPPILMEAVSPHFTSAATNPFLFLAELGYTYAAIGDGRPLTIDEIRNMLPADDAGMTLSINVLALPPGARK